MVIATRQERELRVEFICLVRAVRRPSCSTCPRTSIEAPRSMTVFTYVVLDTEELNQQTGC